MKKENACYFSPQKRTARKNYKCVTCNNEFPINKGEPYVQMTQVFQGKISTIRLCTRCYFALCRKVRYSTKRLFTLEPGSLRYQALSKKFRDEWLLYVETIKAWTNADDANSKEQLSRRIDEMEIDFQKTTED